MRIFTVGCLVLGVLVGCSSDSSDDVEFGLNLEPPGSDPFLGEPLPDALVGVWCSVTVIGAVATFFNIESDSTVTTHVSGFSNDSGCSGSLSDDDITRVADWDVLGTSTSDEGLPVFEIQIRTLELQNVDVSTVPTQFTIIHVDGDSAFFGRQP